ncbi:MAG TPA: hypothetical protein VIV40_32485 [Kofleriaceae bacterium]
MARIVVTFLLCLAACDVGQLPGATGDGGGSGDASGNGCVEVSATPPDGHHNPGMGCMSAAGCHNQQLGLGTGAPAYTYGGTLYKADKTTAYGGATIIVTLGAAEKKVTTASNGNFWLVPGVAGLDAPTTAMRASTKATACPNILPMTGTLGAGDGDCNKGGCHTPGAGQGAIYVQ